MKKINVLFKESNNFIIKALYRRNISILNIKNNTFTIYKKDLEKIPRIYIKDIEYKGYDRLKDVFKQNKYFFITSMICIILMIIISNMIFKVEIMHDDKNIRRIIKEELNEYGIGTFTFRKSYNKLDIIKKKIKKDYKDKIEWIDIVREGVVYKVKIEERIINKKKITPKYCDIISTKDANIISLNIYRGESLKDLKDFVSKGETIVSGAINFNDDVVSYTCANGEVYGNTWYKINVNIPYTRAVKQLTNKHMINIGILRGNKTTRLLRIHYNNYDIEKKKLFSFGKIKIYLENVKEYNYIRKVYNNKETLDKAREMARKRLKNRLGAKGKILSEKVLQSQDYDSIMVVEFFYSVSEPIGRQVAREIPQKGEKEDETTR